MIYDENNDSPFNLLSIERSELKEKVNIRKIKFSFFYLADALAVANEKYKFFSYAIYIGFYLSTIITFYFIIGHKLFWLIALIPIYIYLTPGRSKRGVRSEILGEVSIVVGLLLLEYIAWLSCILICFGILIAYNDIFLKRTHKIFNKVIVEREDILLDLWYSGRLIIKIESGKMHYYNIETGEVSTL